MGHSHPHHHNHDHDVPAGLPPVLDTSIPDSELSPGEVSRRGFLRRAGILGAGAAAAGALGGGVAGVLGEPQAASAKDGRDERGDNPDGLVWLAGDHHIHTRYSPDGLYRVTDHVRHASAFGLDWMVITDHGSDQHVKIGVEKVNPDIRRARDLHKDMLVFQGLEWNIPSAEHGTVFVHPGQNEVAVLKEFESSFDGSVKKATGSSPANEALAIAGINFLAEAVDRRRVPDALFLANHPSRKGIDSPHEIRGWRDAQPRIAVGMEGAPGHQAAGIKAPLGPGSGRGYYDSKPSKDSFPGYPNESYVTWGGFDWMTATVGGLWDSLLAEGKPWWITANSDSHSVYGDPATRGAGSDFNANGYYNDPQYGGGVNLANGDFWPGFYSRTHVGAASRSYAAVMEGIRAGRIWVDHGGLLNSLNVWLRAGGSRATLGGMVQARRGADVELRIRIGLPQQANWAEFVPQLKRIDVIMGDVTGPVTDRDTFKAPNTRVVQSFEVTPADDGREFVFRLPKVDGPKYFRLRGTDGNRSAPGLMGAAVDPHGPAADVFGDADPWKDLWFYSNPLWVLTH
ncbi:PHP domain-containing protein [Planosporangium mesophilum]|uniref:Histidinol-phosphatase n=1 Tax=Planosporangium mesophilum TaxID=689768 RepID=A0A8J3X2N1_9ACTN|nr:PHP domain-containing protein [Planosporangium mesophilum]NJC85545.1 histidinol-phosphatase [Planosporangium mesophilum]GII24589.1 histidinol-phosphatase [Planosporangium mesophilum]